LARRQPPAAQRRHKKIMQDNLPNVYMKISATVVTHEEITENPQQRRKSGFQNTTCAGERRRVVRDNVPYAHSPGGDLP